MTEKVRGLKRLARLYGQVEQIRSLQLRAAALAVAEVTQASAQEAADEQRELAQGHSALRAGDRQGWVIATVQTEVAIARQRRLEPLQAAREQLREQAALAHRDSRQRLEQLEGIVDRARALQVRDTERRDQAASDDRYLARRIWAASFSPR
jgi:hypothetical protein